MPPTASSLALVPSSGAAAAAVSSSQESGVTMTLSPAVAQQQLISALQGQPAVAAPNNQQQLVPMVVQSTSTPGISIYRLTTANSNAAVGNVGTPQGMIALKNASGQTIHIPQAALQPRQASQQQQLQVRLPLLQQPTRPQQQQLQQQQQQQQKPPAPVQAAHPTEKIQLPNLVQQPRVVVPALCPFCKMAFQSLRDKAFYLHVAVFHMPKLTDLTPCDIAGCKFKITNRVEHVEHISHHTDGSDRHFANGLVNLHDHYCNPAAWPNVAEMIRSGGDLGINNECPFCRARIEGREPMLYHLTMKHFHRIIRGNLMEQWKCTFLSCAARMANAEECVMHLGVHHALAEVLLKRQPEAASDVTCPYGSCSLGLNGLSALVRHAVDAHCREGLLMEVRRLQEVKGVPAESCPVRGCKYVFGQLDGGEQLAMHYGIRHGAAVDLMLGQREVASKMGALSDAFRRVRGAYTGGAAHYFCELCKREGKRTVYPCYSHKDALLLHLSFVHLLNPLRVHFAQKLNDGRGNCKECQREVRQGSWAPHAGVVHGMAEKLLANELKKGAGEEQEQQQQSTAAHQGSVATLSSAPQEAGSRGATEKNTPKAGTFSDAFPYGMSPGVQKNSKPCQWKPAARDIGGLVHHLVSQRSSHRLQHSVGCRCCPDFTFKPEEMVAEGIVARRLVLHTVSKAHLFNRWRMRHKQVSYRVTH